ncbi:MAG TPA: hypothetical protein VFT90_11425 [Chryseosolibacter sp.]|nr:hypothetical protein [Chryseosolibacter sp.]
MKATSALLIAFILIGCQQRNDLSVMKVENPAFKPNTAFKAYEDLRSPKFAALREKYQLDTVVRAEPDEFKRQLLLRDWIRSVIAISDFEPEYPGEGYAEQILDEALAGQGYHCGHYMVVQNAVMNAYGYVTRCLGAGPGVKGGPDGHHGVNEVWSNKFRKWYLSDAKYNHHFEKDGIPLSALEIRDSFLKNEAADIVLVKGPQRNIISSDGVKDEKGVMQDHTRADFARTYTWLEYETYNDRYTNWPESGKGVSILTMYEDDFFRNNTWIWDGKPHWAYNVKDHLIRESNRDAIEWTPNVITSDVTVDGNTVHVELTSATPNLKTYQMKSFPDSSWTDVPASLDLQVDGNELQLFFRTVNLAGVTGPEHRIALARN